jgi:glycosyltransferase involved in cell wall biosynthesis
MDNQNAHAIKILNNFITSNHIKNVTVTAGNWGNPGIARNHGIKYCTKKWVMFWDSDDSPDLAEIEFAVANLETSDANCGFARFEIDYNGIIIKEKLFSTQTLSQDFTSRLISNPGIWRFVFSLDFIQGISFPGLSSCEDQVFIQRFLARNPNIRTLEKVVYRYVIGGPNQLTKFKDIAGRNIQAVLIGLEEITDKKNPNLKIISALVLKQILTVVKLGNFKEKIIALKLSLKLARRIGVFNFSIVTRYVIKVLVARSGFIKTKKRIISVTLMGGLGNQLFQLAFAHHVATKSESRIVFNTHVGSARLNNNQTPALSNFEHDFEIANYDGIFFNRFLGKLLGLLIRINFSSEFSKLTKYLKRIIILLLSIGISVKSSSINKIFIGDNIGFTKWIPSKRSQLCIGYFQTFRYAQEPIVKDKLNRLRPVIDEEEISTFRSLAKIEEPLLVHIRLNDYRKEPSIGILTPKYYEEAIKLQMQKRRYQKIWVFSDEISSFKEYIPLEYIDRVRTIDKVGTNSASLLEVMRMCHGYVIANSSLSWWAAFLSHSSDCAVVYPKPWFAKMPTPVDLIPQNWIPVARE